MRKEPTTRLLQLARLFAAEPAGICLDEIVEKFAVGRRTAERMRDAIAEVFPQLEEIEGERPKRWRLPNGLSGVFREPLANELAALHGVARRLKREDNRENAALLESLARKIEASLKPGRRRTLAPDVEALLEAEGFASRPGPHPVIAPQTFAQIREAVLTCRRLAFSYCSEDAEAPELRHAMMLALHTGQREGDLLRLPWSAYDGKSIRLRQGKSRKGKQLGPIIEIPCTQALRAMLDKMERRSALILTTPTGRSFKKRYFLTLWDGVMRSAGLETVAHPDRAERIRLHFHDLRGTTVTLLSEAGSTPQQIASITGHSLKTVHQIMERYLARTRGLAEQAIFNFENSPRTKFANRLQTGEGQRTFANGNHREKQ